MNCVDTPNAIFSQASADGPWLYVLPDGRTTDEFGLAHALASLSARQVKAMGLQISGISGPPGSISSKSADLSTSLGSRLQQRSGTSGSTLFQQTWKAKATASGQPYWAHTASGRRTNGNGCGSWPTPNAGPQNDTDTKWQARRKVCKAKHGNNGFGLTLGMAATLSGWPTPTTRYHKDGSYCPNVESNALLGRVVWTAGPLPTGLNASTEKPVAYRLNPNFSRWLMGFPAEWANSVPTAMPSSRKSRRSS